MREIPVGKCETAERVKERESDAGKRENWLKIKMETFPKGKFSEIPFHKLTESNQKVFAFQSNQNERNQGLNQRKFSNFDSMSYMFFKS